MRVAICVSLERGRVTPRALIDEALVRFERAVAIHVPDGVRPASLFAERDRIVRELHAFIGSRLAARLAALARRDLIAAGARAKPFDAIVRNRRGRYYGLAIRRVPNDGSRLEWLRQVAEAGAVIRKWPISGVLVYDLDDARTQRVDRNLGAGGELQLCEDVRDVVLDRLVG
jgi:hypothetical protein